VFVKRRVIVGVALLAAAVAAYGFLSRRSRSEATAYRFVSIEKGDLESVVSATGTLSAVTTVQVGTQISGIVSKINVDFNDKVQKGQVIAQIDTTLLDSAVRDAEATVERSKADVWKTTKDLDRLTTLHTQGIAADADFNTAEYNRQVAAASLESAEASLARARQNLAYATITAPVSGTVVERDVDVGQTVAASLSAPKLFLIANDLSEMQILASVDESDIGQIKVGQTARFTVKAYPDSNFTGLVKQVRLQSTIDQNVVSYTVVIDVANADHRLLPGMTATVEFLVAAAKDVLKVPNAALRFRPTEAMMAELRERFRSQRAAQAGSGGPPTGAAAQQGGGGTAGQRRRWPGALEGGSGAAPGAGFGAPGSDHVRRDFTLLFYLDKEGKLAATPARIGITDGQSTEIAGRRLAAGMQVIAGVAASGAPSAKALNPFQSDQGRRHGPPGLF
jgi:HlyD family secretion protein